MGDYIETAVAAYQNFFTYMLREITFTATPWYLNYFWALTFISLFVYILELAFPWRKEQPRLRQDFFLDLFYMYFNFFIFKLIFFSPFSSIAEKFFMSISGGSLKAFSLLDNSQLPYALQIVLFFLLLDFVQWLTHIALHRFSFLWNFHKVHHSIEMMGFAGHLRYHWMENVIYTPVKFLAIMLIGGFEPENVFVIYYLSILIGHLNHSNIDLTYGPFKYILNNPVMHIWHHAETIPSKYRYGINFGISLSLWDFLFKTAWIKEDGRDVKLGFKGLNRFPKTFLGQAVYPLGREPVI